MFCGTLVYVLCPIVKILRKTASPRKISLKSDNQLLSPQMPNLLRFGAIFRAFPFPVPPYPRTPV